MKYIKERIEVICAGLKKQSLRGDINIDHWQMKHGNFIRPQDAKNSPEPWRDFDARRDHWYGPDGHVWFKTIFTIPGEFDGSALWLTISTQIDDNHDMKNPQFLLFINGELIQGLDMHHREVLLCRSAKAGETLDIQLAAYTGTIYSEFRLLASIAEFLEPVHGLYYDLQTPLWALSRMDINDQPALNILTVLNNAINLIDFRKVYSQNYFESIEEARAYLGKALYEEMGGHDDVVATCIGHTHIDVAWLWTVAQTREKVARSFATVLKLMDEYPDYKFMSSQPQLYVFLKERYPELYAKVKNRVAEGRWEPEGGTWVEMDSNISSGESLVRQFMHGKRFFKEEFGVDNRILWLPDVFGYSAALPQICKRSGIDYFMTTKLSWNQYNKIPCDTLRWRGIDGSEVFTHFISTLGVGQNVEHYFTTYNGVLHPDAIMGGWKRYQQKDINNDILIAFGYGDGGGGPTRAMLETGDRMKKGVAGIPKVRQAFARTYFEELEARVKGNKRLPVWVGELYFEYHRGTYTSMGRNKRSNRKNELRLMDLELLGVMGADAGLAYPVDALDALWKTLLLNQFHDILPGSSIKEVYDVTKIEYEQMQETAEALLTERITALAKQGDSAVLFNTLDGTRDDLVLIPGIDGSLLAGPDGQKYPLQQTKDGALAFVKGIPSKGYQSYKVLTEDSAATGASCPDCLTINEDGIETPYYIVKFDSAGNIIGLFDKAANRQVLKPGGKGNLLRLFEDKPMNFDNWDIDGFYSEKFWDVVELSSMEWVERGPVRATLHISREFSNSVIEQDIHFYAEHPRIDFSTKVDWQESQHLLKALFEVEINTDEATFDIQFGNVTRKTHKNTSWDQARFESCAHKWMDVSESGWGIALLNDCKYGHSVDDGVMGLTLLKAGTDPWPETDREEHVFTYALLPHTGNWREADVHGHGSRMNQPVLVQKGMDGLRFSFAGCDAKGVIIETVKQAETGSGTVLRVYENQNARTEAAVRLHKAPRRVTGCDLMENKEAEAALTGNEFSFTIRPYEIKTFLVEW
jgi:alpha-mannosidase